MRRRKWLDHTLGFDPLPMRLCEDERRLDPVQERSIGAVAAGGGAWCKHPVLNEVNRNRKDVFDTNRSFVMNGWTKLNAPKTVLSGEETIAFGDVHDVVSESVAPENNEAICGDIARAHYTARHVRCSQT